jgi:amino acid permease
MIIIAIIIAIISVAGAEDTDGYSLILLIFSAVLVFYAMIFENSLKWKAYMLHTNNKRR